MSENIVDTFVYCSQFSVRLTVTRDRNEVVDSTTLNVEFFNRVSVVSVFGSGAWKIQFQNFHIFIFLMEWLLFLGDFD